MLRRSLLVFCLAALAFAKTPRPLANIPLHTTDAKVINLKNYRGKAMVLVIFSTSCPDCVNVLHLMDGIQKKFGPQGLQVIGADGDENARYLLAPFINRFRPSFPIGFVNKQEIIRLADVEKDTRPVAPIVLFIDKWGMVREQYYGDHPIFRDAQRSLEALSYAMIKVAPAGTAEPKGR